MLKRPKSKEKTIAEKVAESFLHPGKSNSENDSADEQTAARVIEFDKDEYELPQSATTEFRKRNVKLLSEQNAKYKGKIVSRKDLQSDVSNDELEYEQSDSEDENESSGSDVVKKSETEDSDSENNDLAGDEGEDSEKLESDENDDSSFCTDDEDELEDTEVIRKVNHEAEVQKGLCVQNQLHIWERLLELRINVQKLLSKTNQLPLPQNLKDTDNNDKYRDIRQATSKETYLLLEKLLTLKTHLASQFSEVERASKPSLKRQLPFKEYNLDEPPLKQVGQYLEEGFEEFRSYRNDVLLKWDDRTKILQPGAGNKKQTSNAEYDIIKKIESALINKSMLITKSQQLKNPTQTETNLANVQNPNIYDDTDFYHQQLRELIEYKANTTSNMSEVTKQFLELQKLRQKMKKKVDTRASKGRKLRYVVHNKLINFMAPHENTTWTMDSINELSKSLFV